MRAPAPRRALENRFAGGECRKNNAVALAAREGASASHVHLIKARMKMLDA